jgi:hypothetical protein
MDNDALHLDLHAGGRDSNIDGNLRRDCGPALHCMLHLAKNNSFRVPDFRHPSMVGSKAVGYSQHVPEVKLVGRLAGLLVFAMRQNVKIRVYIQSLATCQ